MGTRTAPGKGRIRIGEHSGLRKLMRAARRGRVPQERIGVIVRAMKSAAERPEAWVHAQSAYLYATGRVW